MSTKPTGGPAFPPSETALGMGILGVTVRDYFAAKAMQAMATPGNSNPNTIEPLTENAYRWADAMIKARGKS